MPRRTIYKSININSVRTFISIAFITLASHAQGQTVLPEIQPGHPRLMAHAEDFDRLREYVRNSATGTYGRMGYLDLKAWVQGFGNGLGACDKAGAPEYCNVTEGRRAQITKSARQVAMAYQLAPSEEKANYVTIAKAYVDHIINKTNPLKTPGGRGVGGEASMGARIAALAFIYDWMYADLTAEYKQKIGEEIRKTILTDVADTTTDLMGYICDGTISDTTFNCATPLNLTTRTTPSIAKGYLGGHHATASANTLMALLALDDADLAHPATGKALMKVIYDHFDKGIIPARAYVSQDGGHQMGYAYNAASADFGDRLVLFRKGFKNSDTLFDGAWQDKMLEPFLYGIRADYRFPASGDNYRFSSTDLSSLAMYIASRGKDPESRYAYDFYKNKIESKRDHGTYLDRLWDELLYPTPAMDQSTPPPLGLARRFAKSGQVLIRDTWDQPTATILEFKSSSFRSRNHHHLDENSITLFYKKPLLVDSGVYDDYETLHWKNYYSRTVAHNTVLVYSPNEAFSIGTNAYLNDGGQWFHAASADQIRLTEPLLSDISTEQVGIPFNRVDGVIRFEPGATFTYAAGNASKAYWSEKLENTNGFIREVVYLRPLPNSPSPSARPIVLVFDKVRTRGSLDAKTLWHYPSAPSADATTNSTKAGVYSLNFNSGAQKMLTIRNDEGMLTTHILLPEVDAVSLIGGTDQCKQSAGPDLNDCRYLVEGPVGTWINYKPNATGYPDSPDGGLWRVEVTSKGSSNTQFFLTAFGIADNDFRTGVVDIAKATRLKAGVLGNLEAVRLGGDRIVLFNRSETPANTYEWTGTSTGEVIATGLERGKRFEIVKVNSTDYKLQPSSSVNGKLSSADGVAVFTVTQ